MTVSQEDYVLVAAEGELADFTRTQNGGAWAGLLSIPQYVTREKLIGTYLPKDSMNVFVMVNRKTGDRVSSVELIVRKSASYIAKEGKVLKTDCLSGCIGGVFTYHGFRKQGLARIMIDKLVDKFSQLQFVHLYSEVGEYYRRNGFISDEVKVIKLKVRRGAVDFSDCLTDGKQTVDDGVLSFLGFGQFEQIMSIYWSDNEQQIEKDALDGKVHVTVVPTHEMIDWYHARAKYFHNTLYDKKQVMNVEDIDETTSLFKTIGPKYFGFKLHNENEVQGFVIWTYDWSTEGNGIKVILIHVRPQFDQGLRIKLLQYLNDYIYSENQAQTQNHDGFHKIEVWQSEVPDVDGRELGEVVSNGSLSALRMGNDEDQKKLEMGNVIWQINSKLPWF